MSMPPWEAKMEAGNLVQKGDTNFLKKANSLVETEPNPKEVI